MEPSISPDNCPDASSPSFDSEATQASLQAKQRRSEHRVGCPLLFLILVLLLGLHRLPDPVAGWLIPCSVAASLCWLVRQYLWRICLGVSTRVKTPVDLPVSGVFYRRACYYFVWGVGILLVFLVRNLEPEHNFTTYSAATHQNQPVDILWVRPEGVTYVEREGDFPRVMQMDLQEGVLGAAHPLDVGAQKGLNAIAAARTPDNLWMAALCRDEGQFKIAIWNPEHPEIAGEMPCPLPPGIQIHSLFWLGQQAGTFYIVLLYESQTSQIQLRVVTVARVRGKLHIVLQPPPYRGSSLLLGHLHTRWFGNPVANPERTLEFAASIQCSYGGIAPEGDGSVDGDSAPSMDLTYVFDLHENGAKGKTLSSRAIEKFDRGGRHDLHSPAWLADGNHLLLQGKRDGGKDVSLNSKQLAGAQEANEQDIYQVTTSPPFSTMSGQHITTTSATKFHYDASYYPAQLWFHGASYLLFVTKMKTSGRNLWVGKWPNGPLHQLTNSRYIVRRPVSWADQKHLLIAYVDKAARNTSESGYQVRVLTMNIWQWHRLFPDVFPDIADEEDGDE